MKKQIFGFLLVLIMVMSIPMNAHAEHLSGGDGWSVTFTADEKISNNLPPLGEAISGLQPGDDITFAIAVKNNYKDPIDWYVKNTILKSLEDGTAASGGAYSYVLSYKTSAGDTQELYNSETVGGELNGNNAPEGLHEVDSALKDYFFLEEMPSGGQGELTLLVALDGESQGNRYWNTEAKLRLSLAAEVKPTRKIVRTGDDTNAVPYVVGMGVTGLLVLGLAVDGMVRRKKKGEKAV